MEIVKLGIPSSYSVFGELLLETPWVQDRYSDGSVGKPSYYYGDRDIGYDIVVHKAKPMPELLRWLRAIVQQVTGSQYDAVYMNLYRDGNDVIRRHRDFGNGSVEAVSLSFRTARTFWWEELDQRRSIVLGHCDLLVGDFIGLEHWIEPEPAVLSPRVNLTFRRMGEILPGSFVATPDQFEGERK